jgi:hypothetical protein
MVPSTPATTKKSALEFTGSAFHQEANPIQVFLQRAAQEIPM